MENAAQALDRESAKDWAEVVTTRTKADADAVKVGGMYGVEVRYQGESHVHVNESTLRDVVGKLPLRGGETLEEGIYEVAMSVTNPTPDRRCRDWHKAPVIEEGTTLLLRKYGEPDNDSPMHYEFCLLKGHVYQTIPRRNPLFPLLLESSVRHEPRDAQEQFLVADKVHRLYATPEEVLDTLMQKGLLTPAGLMSLIQETDRRTSE